MKYLFKLFTLTILFQFIIIGALTAQDTKTLKPLTKPPAKPKVEVRPVTLECDKIIDYVNFIKFDINRVQ